MKNVFGGKVRFIPETKPKLCINCKHAHRTLSTWYCHAKQQGVNLIDGLEIRVYCGAVRKDENKCGPTAQWFEKGEEDNAKS